MTVPTRLPLHRGTRGCRRPTPDSLTPGRLTQDSLTPGSLTGGKFIGDGSPDEVLSTPAVREVFLGTEVTASLSGGTTCARARSACARSSTSASSR